MATKEEILSIYDSKEGAWFAYKEGMQVGYNEAFNSLRNQAAIAAMQGMLSNPNLCLAQGDTYPKIAVAYADELIKQLKEK